MTTDHNLANLVAPHPADAVALVSRGRPTTYGELRAQVDGLRGGLAGLGVGAGMRVGLLCGNDRSFVVSYLAVLGLGAVVVPLNPASPAPEVLRELAGVGAEAVVVGSVGADTWAAVDRSRLPGVRVAVGIEGTATEHRWEELLRATPVPVAEVAADQVAALLFTSGTAGAPRAARLTHANLLASIRQSQQNPDRLTSADVVYGVLPLFHIFGMNVVLGATLAAGGTVVLVQRFDPSTALESFVDRGVTVVAGAPPMYAAWAQFPGQLLRPAFAGVRLALTGAAKMPEEQAAQFEEKAGVELREGYGLTEASPVVTSQVGVPRKLGSIGVPVAGVEVRLVDTDGSDVLEGDEGELWVRGPNVFSGYWDDEAATARALTADGWLRTGDIAYADDDGYLVIVDRAKDLVIVSGFNVYPAEVEEVLGEHPAVAEVAVVGVPHPHTGEAVKAYVVLRPDADVDEEELIAFASDHLARYKCPNKVLFVPELPRGMAGKVLRRILR